MVPTAVTPEEVFADAPPIEELLAVSKPATGRGRIIWPYAIVVVGLHALSLLALIPWLFSWTGAVLMFIGLYFFGGLGITMCYHRLLAHRSFACPQWFERFLVYIGLCCMQDAPGRWVAAHRIHHCFSDKEPDPHSPVLNFFWGHVGWMLVDKHGLNKIANYERYARDLLRQPFYLNLERKGVPILVYLSHGLLFYLVGMAAGFAFEGTLIGGVQFGLSLLVWGVILRTVLVWHITWSVNSLSHLFGYRSYETGEESRNNWLVALITSGEGWHNNHHADPASASNQRKWWEFDLIYYNILVLKKLGLAWNIVEPKEKRQAARAESR
ncbi:MAG: fatty acid desaturase [Pirellulaceae bacterium]|nr:fatty acid desaturase [Pirellulaceae bacterium]